METGAKRKNITISLDLATAREVRIEAAKANQSVSKFIGELIDRRRVMSPAYQAAKKAWMERPPQNISDGKPYPKREELYDRKGLRG